MNEKSYQSLLGKLSLGEEVNAGQIQRMMNVSYRLAGEWLIRLINEGRLSTTRSNHYVYIGEQNNEHSK